MGESVGVVTSCGANTVVTEPPLLVDRDVETVREAVPRLDAVELGAAISVTLDEDDACVVCEQYALKLGKHDDSGYATPNCMIACIGESAAMKASVADV